MRRIWLFIKRLWAAMRRPSTAFSLGFLTLGGFICGIMFWGGFNTALELTNTETFCTGCHEMNDNVYADLQSTVHFANASGVRAGCPDCHVPHNWSDKIARKIAASKEVYGWLFGTIASLLIRQKVTDPTSGYQAMNRNVLKWVSSDKFPWDYPDTALDRVWVVCRPA